MVFKRYVSLFAGALIGATLLSCASEKSKYETNLPPADTVSAGAPDQKAEDPFLDLKADIAGAERSSLTNGAPSDADDVRPFYDPVGGETLSRVAYALYGSRKASIVTNANPQLLGLKNLSADQKVYFQFDKLQPQARFLTKGMLDRYGAELGKLIREQTLTLEKTEVKKGESLQALSYRLYGTTRYWPEIYLINRELLKGYDRIRVGTVIEYAKRSSLAKMSLPDQKPQSKEAIQAPPSSEAKKAEVLPPMSEKPKPTPVSAPMAEPVKAQVAAAPAARPVASPVPAAPPTPSVVAAVEHPPAQTPTPPIVKPPTLAPPVKAMAEPRQASSSEMNVFSYLHRAVYGLMIVLILGGAYWFTRSNSKAASAKVTAAVAQSKATAPRVGVPIPSQAAVRPLPTVKGKDQVG